MHQIQSAVWQLLARQVLNSTPFNLDDLTYARVDIANSDNGDLMLMELELIEPSLFLYLFPDAAKNLAQIIAKQLD